MRTELTVYQRMREKVQSFYSILNLRAFEKKLGRKLALPIVDYLAFALLKHHCQITTKKKLYEMFELASRCSYKTLVVNVNRWAHLAALILMLILKANRTKASYIKHTDSTDMPVCINKNANKHKTMKWLSSWGHSGKGHGLITSIPRSVDGYLANYMHSPLAYALA